MKNITTFLLLTILSLAACKTTQTLTEEGNYDQAIEQALRKLIGKKKKKAAVVESLESAFAKANAADMRGINDLKAGGQGESWTRIYSLAKEIETRQASIQPLLPLVDDRGRQAKFNFVRTQVILHEAKGKASNYLYTNAQGLLEQARRGDKTAARRAYEQIKRIGQYYDNYKDSRSLLNETRKIGVSRILFRMENDANVIIPRDFEREILRTDVQDLNELWREYYTRDGGENFDYEIIMKLQDIAVSPEAERIREYQDEKEIEDGEEALRDANGNVQKDSSGTIIKVPTRKIVTANVAEIYQSKSAIVGGTLFFYDKKRREHFDTQPLSVEAVFEHFSTSYRGDRRALSSQSKENLGNNPIPFPPDEAMLLDAADLLKPMIKEKIAYADFF